LPTAQVDGHAQREGASLDRMGGTFDWDAKGWASYLARPYVKKT